MATQAGAMPASMARNNNKSPGIIGQIKALIIQPTAFFYGMPQNRQWWLVAILVLVIFGFAASNQGSSGSSTTASTTTQNAQGFDLALLQTDAEMAANGTTPTTQSSDSTSTNSTFTTALLAACGVLIMWVGQAVLLCLVPMLRGHSPNLGRSLQVAVWASLPLALMLGLRQLYFATGGEGGAVGLSLLLDQWEGYTALPEVIQRVLAVFMSNLSLFWLWSMVLLYLGARYALSGKRWSVILVMLMWIAAGTVVPALISEPVTTTAPRTTTTVEQSTSSSSDTGSTSTQQTDMGGMMGGMMGGQTGGQPPSGSGTRPSGGGAPGSGGPGG